MGDPHGKWSHRKVSTQFETTIWAVKLALICVGAVSSLTLVKVVVIPYASALLASTLTTLPCFWNSAKIFLSPPYIYILLNLIILSIVASSSFHHHHQQTQSTGKPQTPKKTLLKRLSTRMSMRLNFVYKGEEDEASLILQEAANPSHVGQELKNLTFAPDKEEDSEEKEQEEVIKPMVAALADKIRAGLSPENPSSGGIPSSISGECIAGEETIFPRTAPAVEGAGGEGGCDDDDATLDSVWWAIMEGQGKPPTCQLKKCETWDSPPRAAANPGRGRDEVGEQCRPELRKSETFARERSELNRRAEAFIRNFKLQREESDQRVVVEMVNRGIY